MSVIIKKKLKYAATSVTTTSSTNTINDIELQIFAMVKSGFSCSKSLFFLLVNSVTIMRVPKSVAKTSVPMSVLASVL